MVKFKPFKQLFIHFKKAEKSKAEAQNPQLPSTPKPTTHTPRKPLNKTQHAYQGSAKKDFVKSNITAVRTTPKEVKAATPKKTTTVEKATATSTKTTVEGKVGSKLKRASSTMLNSADGPEFELLLAAFNKFR